MAEGMPSKPSKPAAPKGAKHKQAGAGTRGRRIRAPRLYLYFDAVVRHGSIRRAAEAINPVPHPSHHQAIRVIREEVDRIELVLTEIVPR